MVVTTGHWDGVPGLTHSPALLTITFRGVAPDTWHTADTGMVVLAEDVAQLTLVFGQCAHFGGVERSPGMLHLTGDATVDLCGETEDEWGPQRCSKSPPQQGKHKALTKLAVLPYIAHRAGASVTPTKVLAGSPILAGAKKARGGHWKKSRARNETRASPLFLPAGHEEELQRRGLKASSKLLTVRPMSLLAVAHPPQTYRSHSAGRCSLGDSHTCTCRCSGNRCLHSGRAPRHRGPAYLGAQGGREPGGAAATCPPCRGWGAVPISQCLPVKR